MLYLGNLPFGSFGDKLCRLPSDYSLRQPSENDKTLSAVHQLEKSIADATVNLYVLINLKAKNLFETVIKELQTMPKSESAVQDLQSKILDFEKQYELCKPLHDVLRTTSLYREMLVHYPLNLQESGNNDVKLIVKVLKEHNVHNFRSIFQPEIVNYIKIFEDKFQELKEPIKRENQEYSNELNKWFEEVYNSRNDLFYKYNRILNLHSRPFIATNATNNYYLL